VLNIRICIKYKYAFGWNTEVFDVPIRVHLSPLFYAIAKTMK